MSTAGVLGTHMMRMQRLGIEAHAIGISHAFVACLAAAHAEWHQHAAIWPVQHVMLGKPGNENTIYTKPAGNMQLDEHVVNCHTCCG